MKNILTSSLFTFTFSLALAMQAQATPSWWAAIYTGASSKDASPSTANVTAYQSYYCTAAAKEMFGSSDAEAVEKCLAANFAKGKAALAKDGTAITTGYYEAGEYTFVEYFASAIADGDYLAVSFYGSDQYKVFGGKDAVWDSGNLTFGDSGTGSWQTASVPEPTSGLLLLLGVAGFCLRRKQK